MRRKRPMRAVIRAYRKSGKMFAQTMHTESNWGTGYRPPDRLCDETGFVLSPYSDPCPCGRTFEEHMNEDQDFKLKNEPQKPRSDSDVRDEPSRQTVMFAGMDCLPGQMDLFNTDEVK